MSTAIEIENDVEDAIEVEPVRRRFTVEEFQRMGEAGIITPGERVELIDGEVYEMTPIGPRHIWSVIYLAKYFIRLAGDDLHVSIQSGVKIGKTQVAPDFAILRLPEGKLPGQVPEPEDCALLVEVADSWAGFDRKGKSLMYAGVNIPEYWVLDLPRNRVVVHRRPQRVDTARSPSTGSRRRSRPQRLRVARLRRKTFWRRREAEFRGLGAFVLPPNV